ncbi:hypothetical protein SAMN05660653_02298 [Desulfonatronum thiosulfatophilum]|uniref:Polyhydroxyalkanoate synthesis regulator phasin n=1 Tax=Desulfonatronum thiosulfatophilum TaxID=617002 RepID=A0A1G6DPV8_9BACT|nr:hypothetical protein [Desulfonatronum thiosulfatophilum]SDB47179.1 hypothetical protein SAMN05660653_02298 [Desulfonatronum thiosulfatophilum]
MSDLFQKGFQTGLGAGLLLSQGLADKANEILKTLQVGPETMRSPLDKFAAGISEELASLNIRGEEETARILADLGLARKRDLDILQARIELLEQAVAELRSSP